MTSATPPSPPRQPSHAECVGLICSAWARLELNIDVTTWQLAGLQHNAGACITANFISIHPKLKSLIALCRLRGISITTISRLNRFHNGLYGTAEKRNRAVHDAWMKRIHRDNVSMTQWNLGIGKDVAMLARDVSISDLIDIDREILKQINGFGKIRRMILAELQEPPSN